MKRCSYLIAAMLVFTASLLAQPFTQSLQFTLFGPNGEFITENKNVIIQFRNGLTDQVLWNSDGTQDEVPTGFFTIFVARSAFSIILGDTSIEGMAGLDTEVFKGISNVKVRIWVDSGIAFEQLTPDRSFSPALNAVNAVYLGGLARSGFVEQTEVSDNVMAPGMIPRIDEFGRMPLMNAELLQNMNGSEVTHGVVADKVIDPVILRNYGTQVLTGSLIVSDQLKSKTLTVTGDQSIEGNSTIGGVQTIKGNMIAEGDATVRGSVNVKKDIVIDGNSIIKGNSRVNGNQTVMGSYEIQQNSLIHGLMTVKNDVHVQGHSTITGNNIVKGSSIVEGDRTINGTLRTLGDQVIDGDLHLVGQMFVQGDVGLNDIEIGKTTAASARVTELVALGDIYGSSLITVPSANFINTQVTGNMLSGNLDIKNDAQIGGNLTIEGESTLGGVTTIGSKSTDQLIVNSESKFLAKIDFNDQEAKNVNIVNGQINGTDIGQLVPKLGSFTRVQADDFVIGTSISVPTASLEAQDIAGTAVTLAGSETLSNKTLTSPKVNGGIMNKGTLDDVSIGQSTPNVATFTELSVLGNTILGDSTEDLLTINAQTKFSGPVEMPDVKMDLAKVSGGNINGTNIGMSVSAAGNFTNLEALNFKTGNLMVSETTTLADNSIQSNEIEDGTIVTIDLADGSVTTGKILDGTIANVDLSDSSVSSAKVENNSLTSDDLGTGSVNSDEITDGTIVTMDLADGSVTTEKILDGTITNVDLSDSSVNSTKVENNSLTSDDLGTGSVNSDEITDGTIVAIDLAVGSVTSEKVLDGTIGADDLADSIVSSAKIIDGAIGTDDLADSIVSSAKIIDGTIGTDDLADSIVSSAKIIDGTIGTDDLADSIVSSAKIIDGTIGTDDLADSIVSSAKIIDGTVSFSDIEDSAIDSSKVKNDSLTAIDIAENAIGSSELADSSVDSAAIIDGAVTGTDILDGTITGSDISNGSVGSIDVENNSLTDSDLAENSVGASELADGAVDTNAIIDGAVTDAKLSGGIDVSKISAGRNDYILKTVNGVPTWSIPPTTVPNLGSGKVFIGDVNGIASEHSITGDVTISRSGVAEIGNNVIGSSEIADRSVSNNDLAGNIDPSKLSVGTSGYYLGSDGTTNSWQQIIAHVTNNSVASTHISDGSVTESDLANDSVTSAKIKDSEVANVDLAGGISPSKITGTAVTLSGTQTLTEKTLSSPIITGTISLDVTTPTTDKGAANKKYVDLAISNASSADSIDSDITTETTAGKVLMADGSGGVEWGFATGGGTVDGTFGTLPVGRGVATASSIPYRANRILMVKIWCENRFTEILINTTTNSYVIVGAVTAPGGSSFTSIIRSHTLYTYFDSFSFFETGLSTGLKRSATEISIFADKPNAHLTYIYF